MTKFIVAKIASLALLISSASLISGCETSSVKPEICKASGKSDRCAVVVKKKHLERLKGRAANY